MTAAGSPGPAAEAVAPWLARDEGKREHYADDPYFAEGWAAFRAAAGPAPAAGRALRHLTFLLVKPEAIAGRRVAVILDFLAARGYRIIGAWPARMGRHEARNLWRYQLNVVPIAHIRALEMLVGAGEVVLLGLDHPLAAAEASAAQRLSRDKGSSAGSADRPAPPAPGAGSATEARPATGAGPGTRARPPAPARSGGGTLRARLGCPALMLNFAHAPDEPADVVRELAVLCDARQQEQIIATLLAAREWPAERFTAAARSAAAILTSRYERTAAHDLNVAATLTRMRGYLRGGPGPAPPPSARAAIERGQVTPGAALEVVSWLESATDLPAWDRIVTAARLVDGLYTGRPPLIGPPPGPGSR